MQIFKNFPGEHAPELGLEIDILYFFVIECKTSLLFFSLSIGTFPYHFELEIDIR